MKRIALLMVLLLGSGTTGCIERRFVVESDPPGALVYHNGLYLGTTPVDGYIIYYGKQQFRIIKEGYETLDVVQTYPPPWYELPGIDFVTENIWPFKVRDVRRFTYTMRPIAAVSAEEVHQRAEQLRARGQTIGPPRPLPPVPAPSTTPLPPPPPPPDLPPPRVVPGGAAPTGPLAAPPPVPPPGFSGP